MISGNRDPNLPYLGQRNDTAYVCTPQFCPRRVILATGEIIKYEAGRKS